MDPYDNTCDSNMTEVTFLRKKYHGWDYDSHPFNGDVSTTMVHVMNGRVLGKSYVRIFPSSPRFRCHVEKKHGLYFKDTCAYLLSDLIKEIHL